MKTLVMNYSKQKSRIRHIEDLSATYILNNSRKEKIQHTIIIKCTKKGLYEKIINPELLELHKSIRYELGNDRTSSLAT